MVLKKAKELDRHHQKLTHSFKNTFQIDINLVLIEKKLLEYKIIPNQIENACFLFT